MVNQENYIPGLKYGNTLITNDIANRAVTGVKMATGQGFFTKSVNMTLDTTLAEISLFGTSGLGVASTITGFYAAGLDTTAVTIELVAGEASVATCALIGEEATPSVMVGPDGALSAVQVAATANVFVKNSASADALVQITFEVG